MYFREYGPFSGNQARRPASTRQLMAGAAGAAPGIRPHHSRSLYSKDIIFLRSTVNVTQLIFFFFLSG